MLHYSDLTKVQKQKICNGCGAKGGFINPPEFLFHASCNQHDFYYWRGGSEKDRKKADDAFYKCMKIDIANEKSRLKRLYYTAWAYLYYRAVRLFGREFFHYADKQRERIGDES